MKLSRLSMPLKTKEKNRENIYKEEAIKNVVEEGIVKMNIAIPRQLHCKFKMKSVQENTNMSNLIINWIKDYLKE